MKRAPELEPHCGSWIIVDGGQPVVETWSRRYADTIASRELPNVEVLTAAQWLGRFNASLRTDQ